MSDTRSDLRKYGKILFPLACIFLMFFSYRTNAFEDNFSNATLWAVLVLLSTETALIIFNKKAILWNRLKWIILGLLALLFLIS